MACCFQEWPLLSMAKGPHGPCLIFSGRSLPFIYYVTLKTVIKKVYFILKRCTVSMHGSSMIFPKLGKICNNVFTNFGGDW